MTALLAGDDAPHEKGVVLILSKEAGKSLKEWEPISERIIFARFESKCQNTTIIQVYAPTNDAEEGGKEDFYQQLQSAYSKRKARDLKMAIGDLNVKVGAGNRNWEASSMRTVKCFGTLASQMGLLLGEHSSHTRYSIH